MPLSRRVGLTGEAPPHPQAFIRTNTHKLPFPKIRASAWQRSHIRVPERRLYASIAICDDWAGQATVATASSPLTVLVFDHINDSPSKPPRSTSPSEPLGRSVFPCERRTMASIPFPSVCQYRRESSIPKLCGVGDQEAKNTESPAGSSVYFVATRKKREQLAAAVLRSTMHPAHAFCRMEAGTRWGFVRCSSDETNALSHRQALDTRYDPPSYVGSSVHRPVPEAKVMYLSVVSPGSERSRSR